MGTLQAAVARLAETRAASRIARAVNAAVRPPWPVPITVEGERLYAPRLDRVAALLIRKLTGGESFETRLWQQLVPPGGVVADVGANLGLFALLAGRRAGPAGRVEAFEPDPLNFAMLQRAVAAAGLPQIRAHPVAVSDEDGSATLYRRPEHTGDHRLYRHDLHGMAQAVPVCRLDTAFGSGRLDAVKIDVQGLEWRVLRGMRQVIAANPAIAIVCEFWPTGLRQSGSSGESFLADARAADLTVHHVDNDAGAVRPATDAELMAACPGDRFTNLLLRRGAI